MKKQGSILIEVIAAIMIFMMTITFIVNTAVQSKNMLKKRILQEEVSRTLCNLMNEFKYNITKEEIEKMLSEENNLIGFRYSTDLSEQLVNTDIKELAHGNDIEVSKLAESNMGLRLKIVAKIYSNKNEVIVEKEFTKSWWMDET